MIYNDINITVERVTSWSRVLDAARWTMGKTESSFNHSVSDKFKDGIIKAQHSPIRLLEFDIKITGIPYCNAVHFVRHHIGIEKFQSTLRDDRNEEVTDRSKLSQEKPVNLWLTCNAEALINISRKRLCNKADNTTKYIWHKVRNKINEIEPIVAKYMVRECEYRGMCPEFECCGYVNHKNLKNGEQR